jgi:hypothetical protein
VWSLMDFFCVPKGNDDIQIVYNGTSSGLNDVLWVPSFPLPTVNTLLRSVHPGTWMADTDLGKMFLNFVLHESLRELAGVDITHYLEEGSNQSTHEANDATCLNGSKSSKETNNATKGQNGPRRRVKHRTKGKSRASSQGDTKTKCSKEPHGFCWEWWTRCAMRLKPSPYQTTQAMILLRVLCKAIQRRRATCSNGIKSR